VVERAALLLLCRYNLLVHSLYPLGLFLLQVRAREQEQLTPLHLAALKGHERACAMLVFKGADPAARAAPPLTAAEIASHQGHALLAANLRSCGLGGVAYFRCTAPDKQRVGTMIGRG
jgi:hypothetical protein